MSVSNPVLGAGPVVAIANAASVPDIEGGPLTLEVAGNGSLDFEGDHDTWTVQIEAGKHYRISVTSDFFAPDFKLLTSAGNGISVWQPESALYPYSEYAIIESVQNDGTLSIEMCQYNENRTGYYTVLAEEIDTDDSGGYLQSGTTSAGVFDYIGDSDTWALDVKAGETYRITLSPSYLAFFGATDSDDNTLFERFFTSDTPSFYVTADVDETWEIKSGLSASDDRSGSYSISVDLIDPATDPSVFIVESGSVGEDDGEVLIDLFEGLDPSIDLSQVQLFIHSATADIGNEVVELEFIEDDVAIFDPGTLGHLLSKGYDAEVVIRYSIESQYDYSVVFGTAFLTVEGAYDPTYGTGNRDNIVGTDMADVIVSGAGSYDRMSGGAGADVFVFGDETSNGVRERDVILDFEAGVDSILVADDQYTVRFSTSLAIVSLGADADALYVQGKFNDVSELGITVGTLDDLVA